MSTATIRDLRTRFPKLKQILEREGELLVTDRGRPAYVLRVYSPAPMEKKSRIDYYTRLKAHQPGPISTAAAKALDRTDRDER